MRILLINYEFPPVGAGAGNATAQIARCLASTHEVRVLTGHFRGLPTRELHRGYTVWRAPALRRRIDRSGPTEMLSFLIGAAPLALEIGRTWRPEVVCAFFGVPCGPLGLLLRRTFGIPYVVSLRGGDVPGFMGRELVTLHKVTMPLLLPTWHQSMGLIANSPGLSALARQTWPDAPIRLIPNGVDVQAFSPSDRVRPAEPLRMLYVGRLATQKGLLYLLDALARTRSNAQLRIVGDGPERPRLEQATRSLGVGERVDFVGWSDRATLPKHYGWADVFVLPSLDEGMPNVVLEAQASGLAVIGTDVAGTRDLVHSGQNGLLVPPGSPLALRNAIESLANNADLVRELGVQARASALNYGWDRVAAQYAELLEAASLATRSPRIQETADVV